MIAAVIAYLGDGATTESLRVWFKIGLASVFFWFLFGPLWSVVFVRKGTAGKA